MKINSYILQDFQYLPVEVELTLVPGLPKFQILGMPDTVIKESEVRIKAALRKCGFDLPKKQQILVNLKPLYVKKKSEGLDLAIAMAYLWETGQVEKPADMGDKSVFVYGALDFMGNAFLPRDFCEQSAHLPKEHFFISGKPLSALETSIYEVEHLKLADNPKYVQARPTNIDLTRPALTELSFTQEAARLIEVCSAGDHNVLLSGPAGSGKTTMAQYIHGLRQDPDDQEFLQAKKWNDRLGYKIKWRPFVEPHHSTPLMTMVGGGTPIFPGEITRAHCGTLFLDELLEFKSEVKEALREPIARRTITVARQGKVVQFPADFMLIATSNLCPCGDYVPGQMANCRFSATRCRSYLDKLSGPLVDRFQILSFSSAWNGRASGAGVSLESIKSRVNAAHDFRITKRKQLQRNALVPLETIEVPKGLSEGLLSSLGQGSRRRWEATLRVARTLADLDQQIDIQPPHLKQAMQWTSYNFERLKMSFQ